MLKTFNLESKVQVLVGKLLGDLAEWYMHWTENPANKVQLFESPQKAPLVEW